VLWRPIGVGCKVKLERVDNAAQWANADEILIKLKGPSEGFGMGNHNNQLLDVIASPPVPLPEREDCFSMADR
jgi:hypothetical protein